ncbi:SdiA-regulated domain-containing protein [Sphingobacterium sp. NGMCC 1.201703]|uniref:SdiA-regulated domain-containing protein n=1 Tax=Sphingobacterium sp. NGMCC 1.201703 TaxID=3388657 RepID=UPI0039FD3F1B
MKDATRLTALAFGMISTALLACNPSNGNKERTANVTNVTADKQQQPTIPYKLSSGKKINLPDELLEISGIAFLEGQDEDIYAIQDEQGLLFKYHLSSQKLTYSQFGKDGDYEDIGISKTHFFILKSNGSVYSFPITEKDNIQTAIEQKDILPKGEYEGLFVDKTSNLAYVLCKECRVDKKQSQTTGYIFAIERDGKFTPKGEFAVQIDELKQFDPKIKKTFKPSALAKKTDSNEWYILSSVDRALVVTDENFRVKSITSLDPKLFPQPEGINFDSKSNLYISSEAGNQDKGIIYKFEK